MSNKHSLQGTIKIIGETQSFPSGFTKRELVIIEGEKYPQNLKLEFIKEGCASLDSYKIGDEVTVDFNIRGTEYNSRYYITLTAWRIAKVQPQDAMPPDRQQQASMPPAPGMADSLDEEDDVPF